MRSNIRTKVCFVRMAGLFLYRGRSGLNNRRVFILFYIIYYIIYLAWFRRILLERIPRIFKQKSLNPGGNSLLLANSGKLIQKIFRNFSFPESDTDGFLENSSSIF